MSTKYKNKYRCESRRLRGWNYAGNGFYFITLVLNHRLCLFGCVKNKGMILNKYSKITANPF